MNDDIERRLRESLRARAQDVEPTPELFTRVETTMNRNKRWTLVLSGLGVAAAVAVGAVVLPNLLENTPIDGPDIVDQPDGTPTPSPDPTPTEGTPSPGGVDPTGEFAAHVVLAGNDRIWIEDTITGEEIAELVNFQSVDNESSIVAVEVRPGSTIDDLTVVFLQEGEGTSWLRYVIWRDGRVVATDVLPEALNISPEVTMDARPVPAFDPTGEHLAWIEVLRGEQNQAPVLRTIGWTDEGPGTGDPASDNASFSLDQMTVEFPGGFQIEDWVWTDILEGGAMSGFLQATSGAVEAFGIRIDVQPDGAIAMDSKPVQLIERPSGEAVVDLGDSHLNPGAAVGPSYTLSVRGSGSQDAEGVEWELFKGGDGDQAETLPVPDFIRATASPGDVNLAVWGDAYAITLGGRTAIYVGGQPREVDADAVDFIW